MGKASQAQYRCPMVRACLRYWRSNKEASIVGAQRARDRTLEEDWREVKWGGARQIGKGLCALVRIWLLLCGRWGRVFGWALSSRNT